MRIAYGVTIAAGILCTLRFFFLRTKTLTFEQTNVCELLKTLRIRLAH